MHICILTKEFPPWIIGGIATWAEALAVRLQQHDSIQVTVMVKGSGIDKSRQSPYSGIRFVFMRGHSWKKYHYLYTYYYLRKYLRKHSEAVIIAATWRLARSAVDLKSRYDASLITAMHGMEVSKIRQRDPIEQERFEAVVHGSDTVIAVSEYTRNQIQSISSGRPEHIHCIPNGTDPDKYRPTDSSQISQLKVRYQIEPQAKVLLTLARIIPRKGHDIVIQALSQVIKTHPDIVYLIVGPERKSWGNRLRAIISELQMGPYVRFTGPVSEAQKLELYQLCDIYLMVSKNPAQTGDSEGFGITFLEANACGKPVIGSNAGGIPDAVEHNVSGLLVEPDDVDGTAEAITKLLLNDELRAQLGRQGRERVEQQFTWDHVVQKILNIINHDEPFHSNKV